MSGTGPLKRATLWVRSAEASLKVYRDALGLEIIEDKRVEGPAIARLIGLEQARMRIVHVAPPGATHGWIGLYEISDTAPRPPAQLPPAPGFPSYGQVALVFATDRLAEIVAKLRTTPGVRFITEPTEYVKTTPGDQTPPGRYSEAIFYDPDGVPVSLMGYAPL
ncbi:MAG: VOC family protein [Steroidobacteraceae bacterium]